VNKPALRKALGSDLAQVNTHQVKSCEYKELTDDMPARAVVNKGGRPRAENPSQLISPRLPPEVIERWRSTGPGWQSRMAERLAKEPLPRSTRA
jgi:uncharacterized protein (DUF4415 family)